MVPPNGRAHPSQGGLSGPGGTGPPATAANLSSVSPIFRPSVEAANASASFFSSSSSSSSSIAFGCGSCVLSPFFLLEEEDDGGMFGCSNSKARKQEVAKLSSKGGTCVSLRFQALKHQP